jgi:hypothetical protein
MHAVKAGGGGIAPLILNLGTTKRGVSSRHNSLVPLPLLLDTHSLLGWEGPRVVMDGFGGQEENMLSIPGIEAESLGLQPV